MAASEELSPTPGRELGLGERDLCDEHDEHDDGEHDEHEKHDELDGDGDGEGGEHYEHFGDGDGYSERDLGESAWFVRLGDGVSPSLVQSLSLVEGEG